MKHDFFLNTFLPLDNVNYNIINALRPDETP